MRARLSTPTVHRVISSPLGALLETPAFERIKLDRLPMELRLMRLGAAGSAMHTSNVDELLRTVGVEGFVPPRVRRRLERGFARFARERMARDEIVRRWEKGFWGEGWAPPGQDELVALETERRVRSGRCMMPSASLGFFAAEAHVPPISYRVPSPGDVAARWARELVRPEALYTSPEDVPEVERSRRVPGPAGVESMIRFRSPSALGDIVHGKVFEPAASEDAKATFIYVGGLFAACDGVVYWPEEECIGRFLAARGHRVVLVEAPFHGRRAPPRQASGEAAIATAPEGLFRLCAAGAQDVAVLVAWAREQGSRVVGVGGTSVGALVAQEVAGRAKSFPRGMRPDAVFLAGAACHLDEVLLSAPLAAKIGLSQAILEAGWTREALACLRDLLDPPSEPGIAPDRIFAVLGAEDPFLPFALGRELLQKWHVPNENVTLLRGGQVGMLLHLVRHSDAQLAIARALHRASRAA
jgi:hypothetical protein